MPDHYQPPPNRALAYVGPPLFPALPGSTSFPRGAAALGPIHPAPLPLPLPFPTSALPLSGPTTTRRFARSLWHGSPSPSAPRASSVGHTPSHWGAIVSPIHLAPLAAVAAKAHLPPPTQARHGCLCTTPPPFLAWSVADTGLRPRRAWECWGRPASGRPWRGRGAPEKRFEGGSQGQAVIGSFCAAASRCSSCTTSF